MSSLSKPLKKHVVEFFANYLVTNGLQYDLQSAYREDNHSECAQLLFNLDREELRAMIFRKAFGVVNHQLLLTKWRLHRASYSTLSWFTSYAYVERAQTDSLLIGNVQSGIGPSAARIKMSNSSISCLQSGPKKNCLTIVFPLKLSDNPRENLCGWHLSLKLFLKWNLGFNLNWPKSRCCSKRRQDLVYQDCTVWCPTRIDTRIFYFQPLWFWSSKAH